MTNKTSSKKKISIFIYLTIFISFAYTVTIGTNWHSEPGTLPNSGIYEQWSERLGLSEKSKNHREMTGGMSGDSIHYITIAMGKSDVSHTPYTYRILVPNTVGFFARYLTKDLKTNEFYNDILFKKISFLWRGANLLGCLLLVLIPFIHYKNFILSNKSPQIFIPLMLMNLINAGVVLTVPYSALDIPTYVIFTLASSFFFLRKFFFLSVIISIGVLVKEVSILLYFPFLYLLIYEKFYLKLKKILIFFLPLVVFICIRKFISGSVTDMGQMRYDILKDPFDFYYFNRNLHVVGLQNFFARVANALLFIIIISFYFRIKFNYEKKIFLMCIFFTFLIVLANFCLASGVMRVSQIALPFLLFYSLESIFQKYRN
jgi:hypothetical protein